MYTSLKHGTQDCITQHTVREVLRTLQHFDYKCEALKIVTDVWQVGLKLTY